MKGTKIEQWFRCDGCFRTSIIEKSLFKSVYEKHTYCVTCRIKKENRDPMLLEKMALFSEWSIDSAM